MMARQLVYQARSSPAWWRTEVWPMPDQRAGLLRSVANANVFAAWQCISSEGNVRIFTTPQYRTNRWLAIRRSTVILVSSRLRRRHFRSVGVR
jgi:hypothetical protein